MISVIVPFYNERESVLELHSRLVDVFKKFGKPFEIIFVDDGSIEGTFEEIKKCKPVRAFRLARNFGQTTAFGVGIFEAKGDIIVTLDGDLENKPEEIPILLKKLDEGYDVVSGWRKDRWAGELFTRKIPSLVANSLISVVTGTKLHDHGSSLRVYKKSAFAGINFVGEIHRMLVAFIGMNGAKVTEVPVTYAKRKYGKSKYGLSRIFRVLLDLIAFNFFRTYAKRPMHFFGYVGIISITSGFLTFVWALALRFVYGTHFNQTPLPILVAIFIVIGFQFILMGLLAEILVRIQKNGENQYSIGERIEN
jgi:dolichol-phosphate mannosyltransferase